MGHPSRLFAAAIIALGVVAPPAAADPEPDEPYVLHGPDFSTEVVPAPASFPSVESQALPDEDPLALVPKLPFVQRYSLDTDRFEVWLCGSTGYTMNEAIAALEAATVDYYSAASGGRYSVTFSAGGTISDSFCLSSITPVGNPEAIFVIDDVTGGGFASPGTFCVGDSNCDWLPKTYPGNGRHAVIGAGTLSSFPSIATHELGHTLQWPHSNSGQSEYDNPIDVMSGNAMTNGGTAADPYGSIAFNRYQSGWIDVADVVFASPVYTEVVLQPFDTAGTQMVVVPTAQTGVFYTLGTRISGLYDPIPAEWEGVEVYEINHDCGLTEFGGLCPGIWREQTQQPPNPDGVAHVLQPGESITLEGIDIEVVGRTETGFSVAIGDSSNNLPFVDIATSGFVDDIVWLANQSITTGCNPPVNDEYCPKQPVTRGQMAAFLVRALGLTDDGGGNTFTDDDGSIFEDDIAKLAAVGITTGCNEDGTAYCPDKPVTRQQMAAFMVRAYNLTDDGGGNVFVDDDGSIFEDDIAKLAAARVTFGCNPPVNTEFCPTSFVTRQQMAAFLHRAAGMG